MSHLLLEKADQVEGLLHETGLGCWLIFARETGIHPDPGVDLVVGAGLVRNAAFLFAPGGVRRAVVARFDVSGVRDGGVFPDVVGYDEDIRAPLRAFLAEIDPPSVGLNYSTDDVTADGLTHGQWLLLHKLLDGTPYPARFTSAGPLLSRLRGRKSAGELAHIGEAIRQTEEIVAGLTGQIRPGVSEADLAAWVHKQFRTRGLEPAWAWDGCPIVNAGPTSEPGHARPRADLLVEPGHLVHVDLGVKWEGYCSDLQRMWYVRRPGESGPPDEVRRAFDVVVRAVEAGVEALRPGVTGVEVDAAARRIVTEAGYPEFKHGLGHGLGRAVHDGGTLLGPNWPCYGSTTARTVEAGNVFTVELGVPTPAGFMGLEEDVVVTEGGCVVLSAFQRELIVI